MREELSELTENQSVKVGERYGIIRFGSDRCLPPKEFNVRVKEGQIAISGETIQQILNHQKKIVLNEKLP